MHPCPSSESSPGRLVVRCTRVSVTRGKSGPALGGTEYRIPAGAISVPADSASEIVKFTISILREWCTNAKAKYSSSVVPRCHLILRSTFTKWLTARSRALSRYLTTRLTNWSDTRDSESEADVWGKCCSCTQTQMRGTFSTVENNILANIPGAASPAQE